MKKIIVIILIALTFVVPVKAKDATISGSISPTSVSHELIDKLKQIEIFKDKIATKVAEKRNADKQAYFGIVDKITDNKIELKAADGSKKLSFAEDTIIYSLFNNTKKEVKSTTLTTGVLISAFGYLNDSKEALLAKYIYIHDTNSSRIIGKIADLNKTDYTITVKAKEGDQIIDIEKSTKTSVYEKGGTLSKVGFTRFKIGELVYILGLKNEKEVNRISAQRIIIFEMKNLSPTINANNSK